MEIFDQLIDSYKEDILSTTRTLIKYNSVEEAPHGNMPFGQTVGACLDHTLQLCNDLGFKTKNVDYYAGHAEYGEGEGLIGMLVHLDIVPAGDGWDFDPFAGEIHDGKLYGRGVLDDKGPGVSLMYALKAIKESALPTSKRARIIFGCNEETGSKCVDYYFQKEEMPEAAFTPDSDFPVIHAEKGILGLNITKTFTSELSDGGIKILSIKGGLRSNMVPEYAEAHIQGAQYIDDILANYNLEKGGKIEKSIESDVIVLKSYGVSAHGSTPELGVNAISHLLCFLDCLDLAIGDAANFVRFYGRHIQTTFNGELIGIPLVDDVSGKLIFNVGVIDMNETSGKLTVGVRYPVTCSDEQVLSGMADILELSGVGIEVTSHSKPLYVPKDTPLIQTLMSVYKAYTGDDSEPIAIGGGTYARALDNGVAFGPLFPGREDTIHQKNEYVYVDDLMLMTKIYAEAIYKLMV